MTRNQYLAALAELGLTPASNETAAALGLTVRACQFYAAGDRPIPKPIALLLAMYLRRGIPRRDWPPSELDDLGRYVIPS